MSRERVARRASTTLVAVVTIILLPIGMAACAVTDGGSTRIGSPPYEEGSGTVVTETRSIETFQALSASRGLDVFVSAGDSNVASVTADDNLLPRITTDVTDGTLVVTVDGSIETKHPIRVDVTTASPIDKITADAAAAVDCEDLQSASLVVRASSGSSVRAAGRATYLDLVADAGATADLRNVDVAAAQVTVSSGSTAHVRASDAVRGTCTVGSTLRLYGPPATVAVDTDAGSTVGE